MRSELFVILNGRFDSPLGIDCPFSRSYGSGAQLAVPACILPRGEERSSFAASKSHMIPSRDVQ